MGGIRCSEGHLEFGEAAVQKLADLHGFACRQQMCL